MHVPLILAGPIVRRVTPDVFTLWLVASTELGLHLRLRNGETTLFDQALSSAELECWRVGQRAVVHGIQVRLETALNPNTEIGYELSCEQDGRWRPLTEIVSDLNYNGELPRIPVAGQLRELLHGSCRKPHYPGPDALVAADGMLAARYAAGEAPPDLLMMSGDQVYLDDLCGPMLLAVHQLIEALGLPAESFPEGCVPDSESLYAEPDTLYGRRRFLPQLLADNRYSRLFTGVARPVFSSSYCDNHLISFSEAFALYLLSWSPAPWALVKLPEGRELTQLSPEKQALYERERAALLGFITGLPKVRRLMAHLPTYMIFDDHDVTDDWNLTAGWEAAAYGHPFSRRIIGNALMAYWFCQGWGNDPAVFDSRFLDQVRAYCSSHSDEAQTVWIESLMLFDGWQYTLPTSPKLVVLDTRTRRWHSESNPDKPSGLMNWEALTEMQQRIMNEEAVVLVSPAPIFGVKLVEVLQGMLTLAGKALAVDAENWMAHPGAASTLLNIFRHKRTPGNFVILSGDVHYSFVYDIVIRFRRHSPKIWQVTASGLKNEFPAKMLSRLGLLNRALFHRRSPLNWLTRRKRMLIEPRFVQGQPGRHLVNQTAIGTIRFNAQGAPSEIGLLTSLGEHIVFEPDSDSPIGPVPLDVPPRYTEAHEQLRSSDPARDGDRGRTSRLPGDSRHLRP